MSLLESAKLPSLKDKINAKDVVEKVAKVEKVEKAEKKGKKR